MSKPNISIKIIPKSKEVKRVVSRKTKRIYHFLKANKFKDCEFEVCVTYRRKETNKGKYKTKDELIHALRIFLEEGIE